MLSDLGRYDEARREYEAALEIDKAVGGDERGTAVTLGQLDTLALRQGDLAEARERYRAALDAFHSLGEEQGEAGLWHQLGVVAQIEAERVGAEPPRPSGTRRSGATKRLTKFVSELATLQNSRRPATT